MSDPDKTQATDQSQQEAPQTKVAKAKREKDVTKITVQGPAAGRWRAGRKFGSEPVEISLDDLSDDELAALKGDPALMCTIS